MRINKMQKFCNGAIHRTNTEARHRTDTEARHRARANVRTDGLSAAAFSRTPPPRPSRRHSYWWLPAFPARLLELPPPVSQHRCSGQRGARDEGPGTGGRHRRASGQASVAVRGCDGGSVGAGLLLRRRAPRRAPRPPQALPIKSVSPPFPQNLTFFLLPRSAARFPDPGIPSSLRARARSRGISTGYPLFLLQFCWFFWSLQCTWSTKARCR